MTQSSDQKSPTLILVLSALILATICGVSRARAEPQTMTVERIVPPGSTLTYSEGGVAVRTVNVPEGRVRVTIEFGGPIRVVRKKRP